MNCRQAIDISDGAQCQQFFPLPKEANLGANLMTNLDKTLCPSKRHDQNRELYYSGLFKLI